MWYSEVSADATLEQGDFILDCPVVKLVDINLDKEKSVHINEYDVIVMSQSCDLIGNKIELALVCPFYHLKKLEELNPNYKNTKMKENLRQGHIVGLHLLNEIVINGDTDFIVVDFKHVYAVPLNLLKRIAKTRGKRNRLLPPYREHLSQAFARFFMRVGLPTDIPPFS